MLAGLVDGPVNGVEGLRVSRRNCWPERKRIADGDAEGLGADQGAALDADGVHDFGCAALGWVRGVVGSVKGLAGRCDDIFVLAVVSKAFVMCYSRIFTNPSQ